MIANNQPLIINKIMRYSIMLQLVTGIAFILVASAALFAWLQYRPGAEQESNSEHNNVKNRIAAMAILNNSSICCYNSC